MDVLERDIFLMRTIDKWEARYLRFLRTEGKSEYYADPANPIDAADFIVTIAGLHARLMP